MIPRHIEFSHEGTEAWLVSEDGWIDNYRKMRSLTETGGDVLRLQALDRPCDTCRGDACYCVGSLDPLHGHEHCPDCIDGRHTFTIEVGQDVSVPMGNPQTDGWRIRTYRVSVIPGMVLELKEWQSAMNPPTGRWMVKNNESEHWFIQSCDGFHLTTHPERNTLPPVAAPGQYAVKLKVVS